MKTHKILIALISILVFTNQSVLADRYVALMDGVVSYHSKKNITEAFKKLPGVKSVRFVNDSSGKKNQKVLLITDGKRSLSKCQATASLGPFGSVYRVKDWNWYAGVHPF